MNTDKCFTAKVSFIQQIPVESPVCACESLLRCMVGIVSVLLKPYELWAFMEGTKKWLEHQSTSGFGPQLKNRPIAEQ